MPIIHTRESVQESERGRALRNEEQEQLVNARLLVLNCTNIYIVSHIL